MPKIDVQELQTIAPPGPVAPQFSLNPAGAFGEGVGQGLENLGQGAFQFAAVKQDQANVTAVEEAETDYGKAVTAKLYDPATGLLRKKGKDFLAAAEPTLQELESTRLEITKKLGNDAQRRVFHARTAGALQQTRRQVDGQAIEAADHVDLQAFQGKRAQALDQVANNYLDPQARAREVQNQEPLIMAEARRRGLEGADTWPPPAESPAGRFLTEWRQDAAVAVVRNLVDVAKDPDAARRFMAQPIHGNVGRDADGLQLTTRQILGEKAGILDKVIEHAAGLDDAFQSAQTIMTDPTVKDPRTGWILEDAARAKIADLPRSKQREAKQQLDQELAHAREQQLTQIKGKYDEAFTAYLKGGLGNIPATVDLWLLNRAPAYYHALRKTAEQDARERSNAETTPEQDVQFANVVSKLLDGTGYAVQRDPRDFVTLDLAGLPKQQKNAAINTYLQQRGQAHKPDETLPTSVMQELFSAGAGPLWPKKGKMNDAQAQRYGMVLKDLLVLQGELKARGLPEKERATEFSKRIDYWLRQKVNVPSSGWVFSDDVPRAQAVVDPAYADKEHVEIIPRKDVQEIRRVLEADPLNPYPVNEENVRHLWNLRNGIPSIPPPTFRPYNKAEAQKAANEAAYEHPAYK